MEQMSSRTQYQSHRRPAFRSTRVTEHDDGVDTVSDSHIELGLAQEERAQSNTNPTWKGRIKHFTWTWFTAVMAAGGIANVLSYVPYESQWLYTVGCIVLIFTIVFFVTNCVIISLRFYYWPETWRLSFTHPTESLFPPAVVIGIAEIILGVTEYGLAPGRTGVWLHITLIYVFWIYVGLAVIFSATMYLIIWSTQTFTISSMTPLWIFPAYPLLLVGPLAGALSNPIRGIPPPRALEMIIGGVVVQGMGFLLSLTMHATYIYRLMTQKLPMESSRPSMFISVGPSAFTVMGFINMGNHITSLVSEDFMSNGMFAAQVSQILAYWVGIWLWGAALFFFFLAVGAHWSCITHKRLEFAMTWNAFVFPNGALVAATFAIAKALGKNRPLEIIGCVMTGLLVTVWLLVTVMMVRGVITKQILWPQRQEDRDEDVWKGGNRKSRPQESRELSLFGLAPASPAAQT